MKKNIIFMTNSYPGYVGDYRGCFIKSLAEELNKKGYNLTIVTPKVFKTDKKFEIDNSIYIRRFWYLSGNKILKSYKRIPWFRMLTFFISGFYTLLYLTKKNKNNLIHAHWIIPTGLIGVLVARLWNIPIILSARGSDINTYPYKNKLIFYITKFTLHKANYIISVSTPLKEKIVKEYSIPEDKISVISSGIDASKFKPLDKRESRTKLRLPLDKKIILFVGSLIEKKGLNYIIEAIPKLYQEMDNILFLFVGEGALQPKIEKRAEELNILDSIKTVGKKPRDEMPLWLNAADIFLLPSLAEGMPNSIMEALACSVPVVATKVGGIPEIIKDKQNGLLIEPENATEIVDKITLLFSDAALYRKIKNNARDSIINDNDISKKAEETIKIYQKF